MNLKPHYLKDLSGGLTAAIISLPMALAFGIQTGLGPSAGVFTAVILAIIASCIGGTKTLISDPTGPMTVVASSIILLYTDVNDAKNIMLIFSTFALASLFQILFGVLKIAKYIKYMPYPVISGFMGGIGLIIIALQLFPIIGAHSPKNIVEILMSFPSQFEVLNLNALLLGLGTIVFIYLIPLVSKKIPAILSSIILFTILSVVFSMDIPRIGIIPDLSPKWNFNGFLTLFQWADLQKIIPAAITLASLGMIDTLLTSLVADNLTQTKHNGNKEMIGQGIGNFITSLFGGFPGAGATMGTVSNIKAGGNTSISGISKGIFLMAFVLLFKSYLSFIPLSVLSGILITVGIGIIDLKGLRLIPKIPKTDAAILLIVMFITLFDTLLDAVTIGVVISGIMFIKRMIDANNDLSKKGILKDFMESQLPDNIMKKVFVKELEGPLFFGFADDFRTYSESISSDYEVIIINLTRVPFMDESGLLTLKHVIKDFNKKNMDVFLVGSNAENKYLLQKINVIPNYIPKHQIFSSFKECVQYITLHFNEIEEKHNRSMVNN